MYLLLITLPFTVYCTVLYDIRCISIQVQESRFRREAYRIYQNSFFCTQFCYFQAESVSESTKSKNMHTHMFADAVKLSLGIGMNIEGLTATKASKIHTKNEQDEKEKSLR